jgi:Dolichyl-phosphate-mannose-protein mannosyltransferase
MELVFWKPVRRSLFVLLVLCLVLEAFFAPYDMNADSVSYLDLADLIQAHKWQWVVNAYWHPFYPCLIFLSKMVARTSLQHELLATRFLNLAIAGSLFLAVRFALDSAMELRRYLVAEADTDVREPLSRDTAQIFAIGITLTCVLRELSMRAVRPDILLATLFISGSAFLMRANARQNVGAFAGLGACFGLAFLVKSVAFPVFLIAVFSFWAGSSSYKLAVKGVGVAVLVFLAIAAPYIGALSIQKGRFSAGDSGGLNYAWYVDRADRFEQQSEDPSRYGLAKGELKHTSVQILKNPPIYFFGTNMPGTEPQWLDPSYWNDGLKPRFNLDAQMRQVIAGIIVLLKYFVLRPQFAFLIVILLMLGGRWNKREFGRAGAGPVVFLQIAQIGMYVAVYTEPRYIAGAVILILIALLSFAVIPKTIGQQDCARMCAVLFVGMLICASLTQSLQNLNILRRQRGPLTGAYSYEIFSAGQTLANSPKIHAGDSVACLGEEACRDDSYWARLAHVNIRTEIFADRNNPVDVWQSGDQTATIEALRSTGARAVVAVFGGGTEVPYGWQRLGTTSHFVFYLQ